MNRFDFLVKRVLSHILKYKLKCNDDNLFYTDSTKSTDKHLFCTAIVNRRCINNPFFLERIYQYKKDQIWFKNTGFNFNFNVKVLNFRISTPNEIEVSFEVSWWFQSYNAEFDLGYIVNNKVLENE